MPILPCEFTMFPPVFLSKSAFPTMFHHVFPCFTGKATFSYRSPCRARRFWMQKSDVLPRLGPETRFGRTHGVASKGPVLEMVKWDVMGIFSTTVVPHKAVVEVSKVGHYRRSELLRCMDGRAIPLMDRKWLELCCLKWLQWFQWSPQPQLLDVVWCSAVVVVIVV